MGNVQGSYVMEREKQQSTFQCSWVMFPGHYYSKGSTLPSRQLQHYDTVFKRVKKIIIISDYFFCPHTTWEIKRCSSM